MNSNSNNSSNSNSNSNNNNNNNHNNNNSNSPMPIGPPHVDRILLWAIRSPYTPYSIYLRGTISLVMDSMRREHPAPGSSPGFSHPDP